MMRTFPVQLRPLVDELLRAHFAAEAHSGRGLDLGGGGSPTAAIMRRVELWEQRPGVRDGEQCRACHGSGQYRRASVCFGKIGFIKNAAYEMCLPLSPNYDPHHELGDCVKCRGSGLEQYDALPGPEMQAHAATETSSFAGTEASQALDALSDDPALMCHHRVIELAYGEVADAAERKGLPREVALWPLTISGKRVLRWAKTGRPRNRHLQALSVICASADYETQALIARATSESARLLELAMANLYEADAGNDGKITTRAARRLRKAESVGRR